MIIGRAGLMAIVAGHFGPDLQFGPDWYAIDRRCRRPGQGEIARRAGEPARCGIPPQILRGAESGAGGWRLAQPAGWLAFGVESALDRVEHLAWPKGLGEKTERTGDPGAFDRRGVDQPGEKNRGDVEFLAQPAG